MISQLEELGRRRSEESEFHRDLWYLIAADSYALRGLAQKVKIYVRNGEIGVNLSIPITR